MTQSTDWLARGGAYIVLMTVWTGSAAFFYFLAARLGNQRGHPNDGCLYGICGIVLALFGGGIGFLVLIHHYPYFVLSSCIGAVTLPALGSYYISRRVAPGK